MPAHKWKWRLRGSSLHFARRIATEAPRFDAIFASSMCNLAELRALLPVADRGKPCVLYFHENQVAYPVQHFDRRDHHFAFTQLHAALAAERVVWNSRFNRDSFCDGIDAICRKLPDFRPDWATDEILSRSELLAVPLPLGRLLQLGATRPARDEPCRIVWNHRWEFDKGPAALAEALTALAERGLAFSVSILGQRFGEMPPALAELPERLGSRLLHRGFVEDRGAYESILAGADVALSTAMHEFQGLAVIEAAAAGAVPLVPDALAYRDIWPAEWRYGDGDLVAALEDRIRRRAEWREVDPRPVAAAFDWAALGPRWDSLLTEIA